jgi:pimeloyl-ACP methyl ester carboxylesterase
MMIQASTQALSSPPVILLPGGVDPARVSYAPLLKTLKCHSHIILKDLEVYATGTVPTDYTLETEIEGIKRMAEAAAIERFHLVGYSGGGSVSLAFAAKYPERLLSLALIEPAWVGNQDRSLEDEIYWAEIDHVLALPLDERMSAFMRVQLRPGVAMPLMLPTLALPWMAMRPKGVETMHRAFKAYHLEQQHLRCFQQPVYLAFGSLSNQIEERKADLLSNVFANIQVEAYEGLHHLNPPHRGAPERFATALCKLWSQ